MTKQALQERLEAHLSLVEDLPRETRDSVAGRVANWLQDERGAAIETIQVGGKLVQARRGDTTLTVFVSGPHFQMDEAPQSLLSPEPMPGVSVFKGGESFVRLQIPLEELLDE